MIDKTIGVIPSRTELSSFTEKKAESSENKKSEFNSYFNQLTEKNSEQMLRGNKKKADVSENKLAESSVQTKKHVEKKDRKKTDEENDEKVVKKNKKKLENNETVSINMASQENANETPDSEVNLESLQDTKANKIQDLNRSMPFDGQDESNISLSADDQLSEADELPEPFELSTEAEVAESAMQEANVEQLQLTSANALSAEAEAKILDTLNQDKLFQKLEVLAKTELQANEDTASSELVSTKLVSSETKAQDFSNLNADDQSKEGDSKDLGSGSLHVGNHAGNAVSNPEKDFTAALAETNKAENGQQTKESDQANLKEILSQAKYLITQGGGEVSVKMSPEGMGEVHLKMMLENGKMNVEMNTHDKNVQKLIQESLSDLKSSLAAHQISVEHVTLNNKINMVQDMQKSADAQSSADSGRQAHAGENSFAQFQNNENAARQNQQYGQQRQKHSDRIDQDGIQSMPLAQLNEAKKAVAHKVYQSHKAQTLNAVA